MPRIGHRIATHLTVNNVGTVAGAGGTVEILPGQVRAADVSVVRWERYPGREIPDEPAPAIAPDLMIDVMSDDNTLAEMRRRLRDFFTAGVRLVWHIDLETPPHALTRPKISSSMWTRTGRFPVAKSCRDSSYRCRTCSTC